MSTENLSPQTAKIQNKSQTHRPDPTIQFPTREFLSTNFLKSELQKRCLELGLTKVWVNKGQLVDMIMANTPTTNQNSDETPLLHSDVTKTTPDTNQNSDKTPPLHSDVTNPDLTPDGTHLSSSPNVTSPPASPNDAPPVLLHHDAPQATSMTPHDTSPDIVIPISDTSDDRVVVNVSQLALDIESIKIKLQTKDIEIKLLNDEVKIAYGTIETLQQRVNDLEQQLNSTTTGRPQGMSSCSSTSHCLLLGDTNVRKIRSSDLGINCSVKTIHGANIDLLRSWINENLDQTPSECVIYCGFYDILDKLPNEYIFL